MKTGIVVFPGSNCDHDCEKAIRLVAKSQTVFLWHKDTDLKGVDVIILPGGFSYGDYLRCGAMASHSPMMKSVKEAAARGMPVIGICNGFQILTESGLLPGVLMRNRGLSFICDFVHVRLESNRTPFTRKGKKGQVSRIPIAHMEGNYFIDDDGLKRLQDNDQIVFSYIENPNGARHNIAGICNVAGNVLGLMPHPERVCDADLGGTDGRFFFESLL